MRSSSLMTVQRANTLIEYHKKARGLAYAFIAGKVHLNNLAVGLPYDSLQDVINILYSSLFYFHFYSFSGSFIFSRTVSSFGNLIKYFL